MSLNALNAKHSGHFSTKTPATKTGLLSTFGKTVLVWQERASMRHNLAQLDKENLCDMGISTDFVSAEIKKHFWQA